MISRLHLAAGLALMASSTVGIGVRTGHLDLGGRHWIHHALYATTLAAMSAAATAGAVAGHSTWPTAAAGLAVLTTLPATSGGSRAHVTVAGIATVTYALGTARAIAEPAG